MPVTQNSTGDEVFTRGIKLILYYAKVCHHLFVDVNLLHVMKCIFGILNSCCTMQNLTSECVYLELNLLDIVELFCQVIFPFLIRYILKTFLKPCLSSWKFMLWFRSINILIHFPELQGFYMIASTNTLKCSLTWNYFSPSSFPCLCVFWDSVLESLQSQS